MSFKEQLKKTQGYKPPQTSSGGGFSTALKKIQTNSTTTKPITAPVNPEIKKLPSGGAYSTAPITKESKNQARTNQTNEIRGGSFSDTQKEVDHIIPVALGGTKDPENLQSLKDKKTIGQTVYDFFTGKKRLPSDYKPENRQEGKMLFEWDIIDKYKKGQLSLNQARSQVVAFNLQNIQKKTTKDFLPSSAKETLKSTGKFFTKAIPETTEALVGGIKEGAIGRFGKQMIKNAKAAADEAAKFIPETLLKKPTGLIEGAKEAGQGMARTVVSIAKIGDTVTPKSKFAKALLGDEPIKGAGLETVELQRKIAKKAGGGPLATGSSLALAPFIVGSMKGLDLSLTPLSEEKKASVKLLDLIAEETKPAVIENLIRPLMKDADEALLKKTAAELAAKADRQAVIDTLKSSLDEIPAKPGAASEIKPKQAELPLGAKKVESPVVSKVESPIISKELQALVKEAEKYKTPEEFTEKLKDLIAKRRAGQKLLDDQEAVIQALRDPSVGELKPSELFNKLRGVETPKARLPIIKETKPILPREINVAPKKLNTLLPEKFKNLPERKFKITPEIVKPQNVDEALKEIHTADVENAIKTTVQSAEEKTAKLSNLTTMRQSLRQSVIESPAAGLAKYADKNGVLPEVTGKPLPLRGKFKSEFSKRGDEIVTELGFKDSEEARAGFQKWQSQRADLAKLNKEIRTLQGDLGTKVFTVGQMNVKENQISRLKQNLARLGERQQKIRAIRDYYNLADDEIQKISRADLRLLKPEEFDNYVNKLIGRAESLARRKQKANEIGSLIQERELEKTDNLRKAMKLPQINNMTEKQLDEFMTELSKFKPQDEFLSVRKLQTLDLTEMKGIRTLRQVKEFVADKLGVPLARMDINVGDLDRFMGDVTLSRQNPLYKFMVDEKTKTEIVANMNYHTVEKTLNRLMTDARKSRPQGLVGRLIPQDKRIFYWLEATPEQKLNLNLTKAELDAATFIQDQYARMRDILLEKKVLTKFRQNYVTHTQREFLEAAKEDGIVKAFKEMLTKSDLEQAYFNIIDDTGEVLPLEKFFKFSMRRSGKLEPTKNVAKAFLSYLHAFEKKNALDSIIPMLDTLVFASSKKLKTPRGLEFDRSLKKFFNEWMNTKKGRVKNLLFQQGDLPDRTLKGLNNLVTVIDLGLNIPIGIGSQGGEQITTLINLGVKKYLKGVSRLASKSGSDILKRYESFVGRTPWSEMLDPANDALDAANKAIFGLFDDASVRANKIHLLGSLTDDEYLAKAISPKRLADLQLEIGKWRMIKNAASVYGATSAGKTFTKYKSWATPIVRALAENSAVTLKTILKGNNPLKTKETQELVRAAIFTGVLALFFAGGNKKQDQQNFVDKIASQFIRDAQSIVGTISYKLWFDARLRKFAYDFGETMTQLVTLQKTASTGELKGPASLNRILTPRAIKQFIRSDDQKKAGEIETLAKQLKKMTPEEANQKVDELDDDTYSALKKYLKEEGMSPEELRLSKLQVKDGYRAKAVFANLNKLKTDQEKNDYITKLESLGIITDAVYDQLTELIK